MTSTAVASRTTVAATPAGAAPAAPATFAPTAAQPTAAGSPDGRAAEFAGRTSARRPRRPRRRADRDPRRPRRRDRGDWHGNGGNGGGRRGGDGPRRRRRGPVRRLAPWIALLVIVVPLADRRPPHLGPLPGQGPPGRLHRGRTKPTVTVQVTAADGPPNSSPRRAERRRIASTRAFVLAAESSTNPTPASSPAPSPQQSHAGHPRLGGPDEPEEPRRRWSPSPRASGPPRYRDHGRETKIPEKDFQPAPTIPRSSACRPTRRAKGFPDSAVEGFLFPPPTRSRRTRPRFRSCRRWSPGRRRGKTTAHRRRPVRST